MTISQRIFEILAIQGKKQKDLAAYIGISTSAISDWKKKNTNPSAENLSAIADFLGVTLDYLLTGYNRVDKNIPSEIQKLIDNYNSVDNISKLLIQERAETLAELAIRKGNVSEKELKRSNKNQSQITVSNLLVPADEEPKSIEISFFDHAASAGTGLFLDEAIAEKLTVRSTAEARCADYAIPISGDSMEDDYHDGDIVLVESCPCVRKGEVGIFLLDGNVFIKEFGGDRLISYNSKYKPIMLREYDTAVCLGKVIGFAVLI